MLRSRTLAKQHRAKLKYATFAYKEIVNKCNKKHQQNNIERVCCVCECVGCVCVCACDVNLAIRSFYLFGKVLDFTTHSGF